jgi:hypothetical protein
MIYASNGVGADPDRQYGKFSSEARFQERITDALYRGAIARRVTQMHQMLALT